MHLFSIKLPIIKKDDPLLEIIIEYINKNNKSLKEGDIIVISEKVIATSQGRIVDLKEIKKVSEKAKKLAESLSVGQIFLFKHVLIKPYRGIAQVSVISESKIEKIG